MEGGALHPDEFGCSGDVAAEPGNLGQEIFPLEDLASLPEEQGARSS
jgi:hypothetical protein